MTNTQKFLFNDGLEGLRIYTIVSLDAGNTTKEYSFYRSSGNNSHYAETWFPLADYELLHIKKPHELKNYNLQKSYPATFITFCIKQLVANKLVFINGTHELFHRFGNLECLCISYLLGGGYWKHDDSKLLRLYLEKNYTRQLNSLRVSISNLASFEKPIGDNITGRYLYSAYQKGYAVKDPDYSISLFHYPEVLGLKKMIAQLRDLILSDKILAAALDEKDWSTSFSKELLRDLLALHQFQEKAMLNDNKKHSQSIKEFYQTALAIRLSDKSMKIQARELANAAHKAFPSKHYSERWVMDVLMLFSILLGGLGLVIIAARFCMNQPTFFTSAMSKRERDFIDNWLNKPESMEVNSCLLREPNLS